MTYETLLKDLKKLKNEQEEISSGWNGEDSNFMVGGLPYNEDDAQLANDIVEAVEKLIPLLEERIGDDPVIEYLGK